MLKYTTVKSEKGLGLSEREMRTKAGTLWENIEGVEKIVTLYYVNMIIRIYREHLKHRKKEGSFICKDNLSQLTTYRYEN